MTGRVFDDAVVEAAAAAMSPMVPNSDGVLWMYDHEDGQQQPVTLRDAARAALSAAADALEGAIRAEALAALATLADEWEEAARKAEQQCAHCGTPIIEVEPFRLYAHMPDMIGRHLHISGGSFCDGSSDSRRALPGTFQPADALAELRAAIADPDAVAGHNAAIWDEGYNVGDPYHRRGNPAWSDNPYRTEEPAP